MADIANMTMSDLITYYNTLAATQGVPEVSSFKSLAEARDEVQRLENKVAGIETPAAVNGSAPTPSPDAQKYNTSGKRGPNQGIGAYAKERIQAGKTNAEILTEIFSKFPGAKTSASCIAYYRSALKKGPAKANPEELRAKANELLKQAAEAEAAAKAEAEAAAAKANQAAIEATQALANAAAVDVPQQEQAPWVEQPQAEQQPAA